MSRVCPLVAPSERSRTSEVAGDAGQERPAPGTVRLPTENRNQTPIHKAANGLTEPLPRPAPPPTRHVRLRTHPGPGYGHAVDRHSTTSAASTAAVARARPTTSCPASPKPSTANLRSPSEAYVPILSSPPSVPILLLTRLRPSA